MITITPDLDPGKELNDLVGKILGWDKTLEDIPMWPSMDGSDAISALDAIQDLGWHCIIVANKIDTYSVILSKTDIHNKTTIIGQAKTLPHAISLAIVRTSEVTE